MTFGVTVSCFVLSYIIVVVLEYSRHVFAFQGSALSHPWLDGGRLAHAHDVPGRSDVAGHGRQRLVGFLVPVGPAGSLGHIESLYRAPDSDAWIMLWALLFCRC